MSFTRRHFLKSSFVLSGSTLLSACQAPSQPMVNITPSVMPSKATHQDNTIMRLFASSGFCEDTNRIQQGITLLSNAGFTLDNIAAAYRRFQRFAGNDSERIADLQNIANGRIATPKVLMGVRGGYGAVRLLPHIDWASLGDRMREQQTLLFGFSDVTAIQLALLAKGQMLSFAGPMLYSDFAKHTPDYGTMNSFIQTSTQKQITIEVNTDYPQINQSITGTLWGGNLSIVASLVGSDYMPSISGGILFLEDVSEQPYRIERMLQTLYLAGILKQQQAIVLGDFRMNHILDVYDNSYHLNSVIQTITRLTGVPILTNFPFGHIANKTTFPLGAEAHIHASSSGYRITFKHYPTLSDHTLNLNALLPFSTAETETDKNMEE